MTCLSAVKVGSTDCDQGLVEEVNTIKGLGVSPSGEFLFDGAGSNDQDRTTPSAMAHFLRQVSMTSYGQTLIDSLPALGRSGTLANVLSNSPVAGHAEIKTGNRVAETPDSQIIVLGNSLAGYVQTKSGRDVTFMIAVDNTPISQPIGVIKVTNEQAQMVEAIYNDL